ncbi:MAG: D-alanyl-D-alanine carboxypeptidase [Clostridiales bacterium]|nr:D-alanyl-D-alanine carboxypeptidase [Clostridiales bacterium]
MRNKKWMMRATCLLLSLTCIIQLCPIELKAAEYWPEEPAILSEAAILMEASSGAILYEKNSHDAHYPASITKILTTLVALENSDLNEIVTFSDRAIDETMGSSIARDYGEQMTMEQCLYAVMLASANECAFAVAEHVGGTMENFVAMMNARAKELGCTTTKFTNPHGLHEDNHYTSAYDIAQIAQAAYENETFRILTGTKVYTIPPTNKHPNEETILRNHHDMLSNYRASNAKYLYPYCTGGKTGYTDEANSTLVTYAEKDGMTLICVVMRVQSPGQFEDTTNLLQYGFDNFQLFPIAENEKQVSVQEEAGAGVLNQNKSFVDIDERANVVLPKTAEFADAVSEITIDHTNYDVVGTISYTYAGHTVGKAAIQKVNAKVETFAFDNQSSDAKGEKKRVATIKIKPGYIFFLVLVLALFAALIFLLKKVYDNYYIIRHNLQVKRARRAKFKYTGIKKKRRRRRGFQRR